MMWLKDFVRKYLIIIVVTAVLIGITIYGVSSYKKTSVEFSCASGFYDEDFYLSMDTKSNINIYYTLDGSEPTKDSLLYEGPILITDATKNENNYSMNEDVSAGFKADLIKEYNTLDEDPGYKAPDYLIDKCTVIRARTIDDNGNIGNETKASYFVGSNDKFKDVNVMSLIINPDKLFGYYQGIYVTGYTFDLCMDTYGPGEYWCWWPGNYSNRGSDWEKYGYIEVFDKELNNVVNKDVSIKIHGGASRAFLPKSLNIYAMTPNDKYTTFDYPLLGKDYNPSSVCLASGGNMTITQFNDHMVCEKSEGLDLTYGSYSTPYVLFINGEYWGFYWLTEKFDENYFTYKYNVNSNNVVMIKDEKVEIGDDTDIKYYEEYKNFVVNNDLSIKENYEKFLEMVDVESFTDYYALMIYVGRCYDWPNGNIGLWRTKGNSDGGYSDGKWRYVAYDFNSYSMTDEYEILDLDTIGHAIEKDEIFASIMNNEEFRNKFLDKLRLMEDRFDGKEIEKYIDEYDAMMKPILEESWKRFYGENNDMEKEYYKQINGYINFFNKRKNIIEKLIEEYR